MRTAVYLALLAALSTVAADPKAKPIPGLKDAQDRYAAALAKAKKEHDQAVKDAAGFYVASLKDIQAERTKAGDLDGAVKVREMAAEVGAETGGEKHPVGTWRVTYAPDTNREYAIDAKGRVTCVADRLAGTMKYVSPGVYLVDLNDGKIERFTAVKDYFLVEHYNPKSSYADGRGPVNRYGIAAVKK
jgi:hypothetical protein